MIINNATLSSVPITSGVPQGTVLGPVLFLNINNLPDNIKNSIVCLFADDCILYRSVQVPNDCNKLQADLNNLEQWEKTWLMKFNPTKCCVMTISLASTYKIIYKYTLHDTCTNLPIVNHLRYLGVTIQSNLKWDKHCRVESGSHLLTYLTH